MDQVLALPLSDLVTLKEAVSEYLVAERDAARGRG